MVRSVYLRTDTLYQVDRKPESAEAVERERVQWLYDMPSRVAVA